MVGGDSAWLSRCPAHFVSPLLKDMPGGSNVIVHVGFNQHGLLGTFYVLCMGSGYKENEPQALPSGSLLAGQKSKPQTHSKQTGRGKLMVPDKKNQDRHLMVPDREEQNGRQASCGQCVKAW